MANNPQISVSITPSLATTTDGSSTVTILSVPFHDETGGQAITFDIVGYDFSNNDVASAKVSVKVKNVSGTLTMVGTPVHLIPIAVGSSSGLATASVTAVVSGSNVNLNVIGVTGRTIKWVAYANAGIEVLDTWTAVTAPEDGYVASWEASNTRWNPVSRASFISGLTVGGDLSGTLPNPTVDKLDGATVPAAGSLTTGNVLQVSGASALTYAPVNLAGGSNYITGGLPMGGDVTGTHSASTVAKLQGRTVASTAPEDGYVLAWSTPSNNWYPATGIPGPPSGAAGGSLGSFYPNPTVTAIDGNGTGIGSNVNVACQNMTFTNGGTTVIQGTGLTLTTSSLTNPLGIGTGGSYSYGLLFQGSNLPNIAIQSGVQTIQWDSNSDIGVGYHDYILKIKDQTSGDPATKDGTDFYISGMKGDTTAGSPAHGGDLILSSGAAGTGGIDGYTILRSGTTAKLTIGPATTVISNATISLPDITTSSTVGAAGGASALPATPTGYISVTIGGTVRKIPYYDES